MPDPVSAALATFVASVGASVGSTALIAYSVGIGQALFYAGSLAATAAIGAHQRRKAIRRYNASLQDRLVNTATTDLARSVVYGRVRNTDGVLFKATRGSRSEYYTLVLALAGHEVDAIETIWFNDQAVTLDGDGYVLDAPYSKARKDSETADIVLSAGAGTITLPAVPVPGSVSVQWRPNADSDTQVHTPTVSGAVVTVSGFNGITGTAIVSYQVARSTSKARVRAFTGAPGQDLSTVLQPLFPDLITGAVHRFAGIACLVVDLKYDTDAFAQGVPQISATMRGAKVYDPRTSATAWTENPALIARDWALRTNGGALPLAAIDDASVIAAANACDVSTTFTGTPTGSVTRPLFTAGMVCRTDADPWDQMAEIVEAMAGKAGWAGGTLRMVAGTYRAPVATITESWITDAGAVELVAEPPVDDAVNVINATIADAAQGYIAVPAPPLRAASYIAADGRELPQDIVMAAVTDTYHAQHVAGIMLREQRNGLTVVLPCNLRALQLELFDVVNVTLPRFGWSAKAFEVVGWQFGLTGGVLLTLKETAAAIYAVDSAFQVLDLTPNTQLPDPSQVPTIGTLTITSGGATLSDSSVLTRTRVTWPAVADEAVGNGSIEVQYTDGINALPAGEWPQAAPVPGDATEAIITGLQAGHVYLFRARAVNALGVKGDWSVMRSHVVAAPPLLGTGGLEPNAATNTDSDTFGYATFGADLGAFGSPTAYDEVVREVSWTNNTAAPVVVQFEAGFASGQLTFDATDPAAEVTMEWSSATLSGSRVLQAEGWLQPGTSISLQSSAMLADEAVLPAGETISVRLRVQVTGDDRVILITQATFARLAAIKR